MAIIKVTSSGAGAASVPDATTTVVGKVRLATTTEATTGTSESIAVTPAGLAASISGIVGGMTYKGFFDAINAVPDLSNAEQGDFYKVSAAGTRYGQSWAVGDMLVINEDMGGTISNGKIDKIDNTESVLNLNDLLDVNAGSPSSGDVLQWSGAAWINHALVAADVSGVATSVQLDAEAATRASADTTLQANIDTEAATRASGTAALQAELNTTQTGAGLLTTGAYQAPGGSNYLGSATSLKNADSLLDAQLKVATDKGTSLQGELDATQVGAGLGTGGAYTAPVSSNYLGAASSLKNADSLLDTALKALSDQVDTLGGSTVTSVNTIAPVAGDVTLGGADIDTAHTAVSYTAAAADLDSHLAGVDTALGAKASQSELDATQVGAGLGTGGAYTAPVSSNYLGAASSLKNADSLLDTALKSEETARTNADTALQSELNTTQAGAGLGANGAYTAPVSSNYLGAASSLKNADSLLDAKLKETRDLVDGLGAATVSTVNGIAPVAGDVTVTATDITGFASVATSGAYADLSGTPSLATVATSGAYADLSGTPTLATVATSGAYSDLSGAPTLATVATSGAYADLSGSPTLATVATSGAYADLSGSPSLAAVATSGAADDVSVTASPVNYTAASADVEAHLAGIDTVLGTLGGANVTSVNGVAPVGGDVTLTAQDLDTSHTATNYTAAGASITEHIAGIDGELGTLDTALQAAISDVADLTANRLSSAVVYVNAGVEDVQDGVDAVTGANTLVWCSPGSYGGATVTLVDKNLIKVRAEGVGTGAFGIAELVSRGLTISGASSTRNLVQGFQIEGLTTINGTQGRHALIDCQLVGGLTITNGTSNFVTIRDCDIAGTATIAAGVSAVIYFINCNFAAGASIANSASAAQVIVANCGGVPAAALASVTMAGQSGLSDGSFRGFFSALSLPSALAFTGNTNQLTNGAGFITAASAPVTSVNTLTGAVTLTGQNTTSNHTAVNYTAATTAITSHLAGIDTKLGTLGGSTVVSVNSITPVGGNVTLTATDITGFASVATSGAYADLSGAPSLATVATSGAYSDLSGAPSLATVATSGAYSDLSGAPSLGTAAAEDVGTSVGDVVQLVDVGAGLAGLPAVDGSLLSGLDYGNLTNVPKTFVNGLQFITSQAPLTLVAGTQYIISTATDTLKVLTVPITSADVENGDIIRVTNWGLGRLKLTTGGGNTAYLLSGQDVVGGASAGELFIESKCTVDLVGFNYAPGDLLPAWGAYFASSIETNTRSFTTSGQSVIYNATTKKLESGSADDFLLSYTPTNYTPTSALIGGHLGGVDTALGLKANSADLADVATSGAGADVSVAHTASDYTAATADVEGHFAGVDTALSLKAVLADGLSQFEVDIVTTPPTNNQTLLWSAAQSKFLPADPPAPEASTTQRGLIEIATDAEATAGSATDKALVPSNLAAIPTAALDNSAGTLLEAASNLSDLADASTARINLGLGTAATANTGTAAGNVVVLADVGGVVKLPAVDGSQLLNINASGLGLGTAAFADTGTAAGNVVVLADVGGVVKLPAVDGSQLSGIVASASKPTVTSATPSGTYAITTYTGLEEVYVLTPTSNTTVSLPAAASAGAGYRYRIKNLSTFTLTIDPNSSETIDGAATFSTAVQYASISLLSTGAAWIIV